MPCTLLFPDDSHPGAAVNDTVQPLQLFSGTTKRVGKDMAPPTTFLADGFGRLPRLPAIRHQPLSLDDLTAILRAAGTSGSDA
jgi:hypothetical protein